MSTLIILLFFFNDTATTEIYTLSLPRRSSDLAESEAVRARTEVSPVPEGGDGGAEHGRGLGDGEQLGFVVGDRKSTRLNSSHANISYAVFCLKKKKKEYV